MTDCNMKPPLLGAVIGVTLIGLYLLATHPFRVGTRMDEMDIKDIGAWMMALRNDIQDIKTSIARIGAQVSRVERQQQLLMREQMMVEAELMATKATDQALIAEVHRNTDVANAARDALTKLQSATADLTQKLADAIANSDAADDSDVQAVLAELKANNDSLAAATPALSTAIANTDPAAPVPTAPTDPATP